jgi:hypothetical protein
MLAQPHCSGGISILMSLHFEQSGCASPAHPRSQCVNVHFQQNKEPNVWITQTNRDRWRIQTNMITLCEKVLNFCATWKQPWARTKPFGTPLFRGNQVDRVMILTLLSLTQGHDIVIRSNPKSS